MTRRFSDYRIIKGDSLESIALSRLGAASQWRLLASLNRLRYPFISDDPVAQYGSPLFDAATAAPIVATNTTYTVALPVDETIFAPGNVFYVQKVAANGVVTYDALEILSVNTGTGVLTFTTAFAAGYLVGTVYLVFGPLKELATQVLRTGDVLRIPSAVASDVIAVGSGDFVDLLGTDLGLDAEGSVTFGSNGDLSVTSGVANLTQALRLRLNTPVGTRMYDGNYGNQAFDHVGENGSPYFYNLIAALVSRAIIADPRISAVTDVKVKQNGPVLSVDAQVQIAAASQLLRLSNLVLRFVGGV